jgi:hypothetical protein
MSLSTTRLDWHDGANKQVYLVCSLGHRAAVCEEVYDFHAPALMPPCPVCRCIERLMPDQAGTPVKGTLSLGDGRTIPVTANLSVVGSRVRVTAGQGVCDLDVDLQCGRLAAGDRLVITFVDRPGKAEFEIEESPWTVSPVR